MQMFPLAAWTALLAATAHANVLVVSPTGPHTSIQAAVDASADEDVVLVKSGTYSGFTVHDRALFVVADEGAFVQINGAIRLESLAATRSVHIAGVSVLGMHTSTSADAHGALVSNCLGAVRFQDCTLLAAVGTGGSCSAHMGATVQNSQNVAFVRCELRGVAALPAPLPNNSEVGPGGSGLSCVGSRVALYDCQVSGGQSGVMSYCDPSGYGYLDGFPGPAGLLAEGSTVWASGCDIRGGRGGDAGGGAAKTCAAGGTAVRASGTSTVHLIGCATVAGIGGHATYHQCPTPGPTEVVAPATITAAPISSPPVHYRHDRVLRVGQATRVDFQGLPFDVIAASWAPRDAWIEAPLFLGVHLTPLSARLLRFGTCDATGLGVGTLIAPPLPVGTTSRVFRTQSLHHELGGQFRLGPCEILVVLDPAY